jgi:CheY-like chemotaxis protein
MDPSSLCILVVDDDRDAADSLGLMLEGWGHRPLIAHDPANAWELAVSYQPAVALLDIGLPGVDGWELARRLRAEPVLRDIQVIAVTGYQAAADYEKAAAAGVLWHLVKPVDPDLLRRLLVTCWLRRAQRADPSDP